MAGTAADGSIVYGLGPDGQLHHIEEVERGEACGCVCPDPRCGQPLIARKGEVRAHHFAHKSGTCKWAVEYVISSVASRVVAESGKMVFPGLTYRDSMTGGEATLAESQAVGVSSAELVELSGRGNPDLLVTRKLAGTERKFLVAVTLAHALKPEQSQAMRATGLDCFVVDLKRIYDWRRSQDRHFDREALPLEFQDPGFLRSVLVDGDGRCMRWVANAKREAREEESRREYELWRKQEEARRKRQEEERRKCEADRKREIERLRRENAEQRRRREAEAARAAEEADRARQAAMAAERIRIEAELDQQERQVRDSFGNRWIRCKRCGKVATEESFQMYGGAGHVNLGVCYDCARGQK